MRRKSWRRAMAGITVVVAYALTGCAAEPSRLSPDLSHQALTPVAATQQHITPAWTVRFAAASDPVVSHDVVLAYEHRGAGQSLELVAFDVSSGRELWRRPASTGAIRAGERPRVAVAVSNGTPVVAYLEQPTLSDETKQYRHRLILADLRTGVAVQTATPGFVGALGPCPLQAGLCLDLSDETGARRRHLIDPNTAAVSPFRAPVEGEGLTDLGNGVYSLRRDGQTVIGSLPGGWQHPVSDWIGTPVDLTTAWHHLQIDPQGGQLLLSVRPRPVGPEANFPVAEVTAVKVDLFSGDRLSLEPGQSLYCPGGHRGLACTGEITFVRNDPARAEFTPRGGKVTFHGIDPQSLQPWQAEAEQPQALTSEFVLPTDLWAFTAGGQPMLGNLGTGELTPVEGANWIACRGRRTFADHQWSNPTLPLVDFSVPVYRPCNGLGETSDAAPQFSIAGILAVSQRQAHAAPTTTGTTVGDAEAVPGSYPVAMPDQLAVFR